MIASLLCDISGFLSLIGAWGLDVLRYHAYQINYALGGQLKIRYVNKKKQQCKKK